MLNDRIMSVNKQHEDKTNTDKMLHVWAYERERRRVGGGRAVGV